MLRKILLVRVFLRKPTDLVLGKNSLVAEMESEVSPGLKIESEVEVS